MSEVIECFKANILNVSDLSYGCIEFSLKCSLQQKPKESIKLECELSEILFSCKQLFYTSFRLIDLGKLKLTFDNYIHEIQANTTQKYAYKIDVRALVSDNRETFHVNFPRVFQETRITKILNFKSQGLVLPDSSELEISHVCFNIHRLRLDEPEKNDKLLVYTNFCELSYKSLSCDLISLTVGDQNFSVHRETLCSSSDVFAAMFNHEMQENNTKIIKIEDFKADVIEEMIKFMYTNEITETIEHPQDLYAVAHKYQMENLKAKCLEYLIFNLNFSNATNLYRFAKLYDIEYLMTTLNLFFNKYMKNMVDEETYRNHLSETIILENIVDILLLCTLYEKLEDVQKSAFNFVKNNISEVLALPNIINLFKDHPKFTLDLFKFIHPKN
ncbi:hypothetical protein TKK_0001418 [Trichogramma kaykai]|uniref:BTB domain-containing protein n=1 Tax=Trichogramma kaykai TaxID=54128 RepID=A0ABD2X1L0_9HYME